MRRALLIVALVLMTAGLAVGQTLPAEPSPAASVSLPRVTLNTRAAAFQSSLYPEFYRANSLARDLRWVRTHDGALIAFWQQSGDRILSLLAQLSGLDWIEREFDFYLLRYYPSMGAPDPLAIPLGGVRRGQVTVAAPEGSLLQLDLIYQLAHRILMQAEYTDNASARTVALHPLMQPGPYRRDNLALLLALVTAQEVIGLDSTLAAYNSAFLVERTPGRQIFEEYLLSRWVLSPSRTLARYLAEEPSDSPLVQATRAPRRSMSDLAARREYVEGVPLKGQLGFSVQVGGDNRLVVDRIDTTRLAYECGLRRGDVIRSVDGRRARTHKELAELLLDRLDRGGATVSILRNGEHQTVVIQPGGMIGEEEELAPESSEDLFYSPADTSNRR